MPDFNIKEWMRTLREIEKLDFQTAIYSHSRAKKPFGSKSDVTQTRKFIEDMQAAIVAEFKKGTPFTRIPNTVKLPKYAHWAMYKEWLPLNVWSVTDKPVRYLLHSHNHWDHSKGGQVFRDQGAKIIAHEEA